MEKHSSRKRMEKEEEIKHLVYGFYFDFTPHAGFAGGRGRRGGNISSQVFCRYSCVGQREMSVLSTSEKLTEEASSSPTGLIFQTYYQKRKCQ